MSFITNLLLEAQSATRYSTAQYNHIFDFFGGGYIQLGVCTARVILIVAVLFQCGAQAASVGPSSHLDASNTLLRGQRHDVYRHLCLSTQQNHFCNTSMVIGSCFINNKILRCTWPLCQLLIATLTWIGASTLVCPVTSAKTRRTLYPWRNATCRSLLPKREKFYRRLG